MKKLKWIIPILGLGLTLNACIDVDDDVANDGTYGMLAFYNLSPDSQKLRFYTKGNPINENPVKYGDFFGYIYHYTGQTDLTVQGNLPVPLDTLSLQVNANQFYSVFAVNKFDAIELVKYDDNHSAPTTGNTTIRFIQLSHNAPYMKLSIEGISQDLGDYYFKDHSSFVEIPAVSNKNLYLIDGLSNDTILTKQISLNSGKSYSVISKGFYGSTDENQQLDVQVIPF